MTHLIQDNGNVIDNPDLISQHARDYYYDLFTPKLLVKEHVLLSGMKHISEKQSIMCDKAVTFKELTIVMETLVIDQSPVSDGFPVNFYRIFFGHWGMIFSMCYFLYPRVNFPYHVDVQFCHCYLKVAIMVTLKTGDQFTYYVQIINFLQN